MFMLQLNPPGKGLPDGTTYDTPFATVPDDVPSNILKPSLPM